ncbi:MAG: DNA repair protein RecO [Chloroflexota bacterium]|nr:DNA repair protein RecO [Chloroflexota bacterium]|tara:strand:- start:169 stop:918 length:750 start_codon:yes stop_codon:yes gene_type:complete
MKSISRQAKGIITRCTNYKEADRIFTLISDNGIMKFIARGAKKPSSKLSGHIEPLNYVMLYYRPSKSLNSVSQVESISSFLEIKKEYNLILRAQYMMELSESLSSENEDNSYILSLLISTLSNIHNSKMPDLDILIFEFELLKYQGFGIRLFDCTNCNKKLERSDHYFSSKAGGFYCGGCFESKEIHYESIKVTIEQQLILRTISRKKYKGLINLNLAEKEINNCRKLIQKSIRDIIGVQLKTVKFSDL